MKKSAWHLHGTEEGLQQIGKLHLAARDSGQTILEIDVCGKRGVGFCESMPGAVHPFERVNTVAIPSQALLLDGRREGTETRRQHLRRERARVNEVTRNAASRCKRPSDHRRHPSPQSSNGAAGGGADAP